MGLISAWTNHRSRQAGKYAKRAYRQQMRVPRGVAARQLALPRIPMPSPPMPQPMPQPMSDGRYEVWCDGWQAGQRDLVQKLLSGELVWDDVVARLGTVPRR